MAAEERWEELGYEAVPHPWFEPPPDFATDCCLDELRLALGLEELDRYRAAGSDGADAFVAALGALRPELSELGAAGELAGRLAARGFTTPVVLVGGERRAPVHRHPLPTGERLGRFGLLAVTAEREGLYVSLTRVVSFGPAPRELERLVRAAAEVDAAVLTACRPGATLGELFEVLARVYEERLSRTGGLRRPGRPDPASGGLRRRLEPVRHRRREVGGHGARHRGGGRGDHAYARAGRARDRRRPPPPGDRRALATQRAEEAMSKGCRGGRVRGQTPSRLARPSLGGAGRAPERPRRPRA